MREYSGSDWWKEAWRIMDKCPCGGYVSIKQFAGGYMASCTCGNKLVQGSAVMAFTSWNQAQRQAKESAR
jgi:hypothetical protein